MFQQGKARSRPPLGKAQAHENVAPLSNFADNHFEPLPHPLGSPPFHYNLESALPGITQSAAGLHKIIFHTVGDTGGIKNADYQAAVAAQMKDDLTFPENKRPHFFYH